ncbi:MAG: aminomethyl-transferring glycine dehydrogenase subunit GcvPA [Prevotella sp.]|nr:aminomethyl-transferring glycine dehydrogenase subunit GcvPA [Prevotella sp.]MBR7054787.1 aminomethyl-transferring glycine dehydrogenase subunit GcvPA [Prevotella sp.]
MHKYLPHTQQDIELMLRKVGVESLDALYAEVPEGLRLQGDYDLPDAQSEMEIRQTFERLCEKNQPLTIFAGGGVYDHYTPAVVPSIIGRSEFLTSYTPYQAEISQGTLHYIFEYQSTMAELTGMDISNASMYDGTTATAEAVLMAAGQSKKANRVLLSETIDPKTAQVVRTYARFHNVEIATIAAKNGVTDAEDLKRQLEEGGVAGVVVQQPNRHGIVEDFSGFADAIHDKKALFIINSVALDLAVLRTPGEWGADIAVGDCQSLGMPMSFGGPYVGYMCCSEKLMRKMPGRIVGMTTDSRGQRVFVLTLQAREQHIRRQKATSNICSNQSLMALWATVYCAVMGKEGVKEAAQRSCDAAHYLAQQLVATGRFRMTYDKEFFNEFCIDYDGDVDTLLEHLANHGILGGLKTGDHTLMLAVTEKRTKEEVDQLVRLMKEC